MALDKYIGGATLAAISVGSLIWARYSRNDESSEESSNSAGPRNEDLSDDEALKTMGLYRNV